MKPLHIIWLLFSLSSLSSALLSDFTSLPTIPFLNSGRLRRILNQQHHALPVDVGSHLNATNQPLISDETSKYIEDLLKGWNSTGLAVAVVQKDASSNGLTHPSWKVEFASYGLAFTAGTPKPISPDTLIPIASNSKLFLSISVGLLLSNKSLGDEFQRTHGVELGWKTKLQDIMPGLWKLWDEDATSGATIQDLLSHRTGLPRHDFSLPTNGGVENIISKLRHLRPSATFRETFQYNNLMYETLSYLPTLLLNQSYESYVSQHLFQPLNMTSTTFSIAQIEGDAGLKERMAQGHLMDQRDLVNGVNGTLKPILPFLYRPGEEKTLAGAGGVISTARDLSTWIGMLLNEGRHPYTNEPVVPPSVLEYVTYGRVVAEGSPEYPELSPRVYGCAQFRYSYRGTDVIEHGGNLPGFRSQIARFPEHDGETGGFVLEAAKWRILDDKVFKGGERVDWDSRHKKWWEGYKKKTSEEVTPPPSPRTPPSGGYTSLGRKAFTHATYGTLTPCLVPPSSSSPPPLSPAPPPIPNPNPNTAQTPLSPTPNSEHKQHASTLDVYASPHINCTHLLSLPSTKRILKFPSSSYTATTTPANNTTTPTAPSRAATYIIPYPRAFATHLRLVHFNANLFNVSVVYSNADTRANEGLLNGSRDDDDDAEEDDDDILIGLDTLYTVEYVENQGLSFKDNFWGRDGLDSREPEGEGKESASVWFEESDTPPV